jgi:hypothetical protein
LTLLGIDGLNRFLVEWGMTTSLIAALATELALAQNALTNAQMSGTRAVNALWKADKTVQYWSKAADEATNQWDAAYANVRYNLALDDQKDILAYIGQVEAEVNARAGAVRKARFALEAGHDEDAEAYAEPPVANVAAALAACHDANVAAALAACHDANVAAAEMLGDKQA